MGRTLLHDEGVGHRAASSASESDLQAGIAALPPNDVKAPGDWIDAKDREEWDRRIAADSAAGKLDFLKQGALAAKAKEPLGDL